MLAISVAQQAGPDRISHIHAKELPYFHFKNDHDAP